MLKFVVGRDYVTEITRLVDGCLVVFKYVEGSFLNLNGGVVEFMVNYFVWICVDIVGLKMKFIELYVGCGNYTCCMAS